MNDDSYCLFVTLASLIALGLPTPGQVVYAVVALPLVLLAGLGEVAEGRGEDHAGDRSVRRDLGGV